MKMCEGSVINVFMRRQKKSKLLKVCLLCVRQHKMWGLDHQLSSLSLSPGSPPALGRRYTDRDNFKVHTIHTTRAKPTKAMLTHEAIWKMSGIN